MEYVINAVIHKTELFKKVAEVTVWFSAYYAIKPLWCIPTADLVLNYITNGTEKVLHLNADTQSL